mgnify:CR=1 FL=1
MDGTVLSAVYELTGDQDYYSALMKMWNHIKGAKNDYKGVGGMAWKTDAPASRMSCSNGPVAFWL